ncbi:MAG: hypothetical protein AB7R87_26350 [Parvibaculaceae bacterium]
MGTNYVEDGALQFASPENAPLVTASGRDGLGIVRIAEQRQRCIYVGQGDKYGPPLSIDLVEIAGQFRTLADKSGYDMGIGHAAGSRARVIAAIVDLVSLLFNAGSIQLGSAISCLRGQSDRPESTLSSWRIMASFRRDEHRFR